MRTAVLLLSLLQAPPAPAPNGPPPAPSAPPSLAAGSAFSFQASAAPTAPQPSVTPTAAGPPLFAQAAAAPALKIPAEVRPSGQYVAFIPDTDAASVLYVGLSGLDPVPSLMLADKRAFVLDTWGKQAGRYKFVAVAAAKTGEQARQDFVVVIGDGPGPPPPPPPPPPPDPADPLAGPLQAAYAADVAADKQKHLAVLVELFRQLGGFVGEGKIATVGQLNATLRSTAAAVLPQNALRSMRDMIASELAAQLGKDSAAPLDRAKASALLARFARLLGGIK